MVCTCQQCDKIVWNVLIASETVSCWIFKLGILQQNLECLSWFVLAPVCLQFVKVILTFVISIKYDNKLFFAQNARPVKVHRYQYTVLKFTCMFMLPHWLAKIPIFHNTHLLILCFCSQICSFISDAEFGKLLFRGW